MSGGTGLRGGGTGLRELFAGGTIRGRSTITIRSILTRTGFTQTISHNKQGYLFYNNVGEMVRIMRRAGGWDVRVTNRFGNYLDEFGNVAGRAASHGIWVSPY